MASSICWSTIHNVFYLLDNKTGFLTICHILKIAARCRYNRWNDLQNFLTSHSLTTLHLINSASRPPFQDLDSAYRVLRSPQLYQNVKVSTSFDALYSWQFVDVRHGKIYYSPPPPAVRETNKFEDADFGKNCGNITAFFWASCKHRGTT